MSPLLGRPDDGLVYLAGLGEANHVVIDADAGTDTFLVTDGGAAVAAGDSCVPVDVDTARCGPRSGPDVRARSYTASTATTSWSPVGRPVVWRSRRRSPDGGAAGMTT